MDAVERESQTRSAGAGLVLALAAGCEQKRRSSRKQECQPNAHALRYVAGTAAVSRHVTVYSGPEPPSGGVRRPPFAVIAPH